MEDTSTLRDWILAFYMNSDTKIEDSRTDSNDELLLSNGDSELSDTNDDSNKLDTLSNSNFQEALKILQSKDGTEMPGNLQGGIVLDQTYAINPDNLNILIFGPNSEFKKALAERRNLLDYLEEPWSLNDKDVDECKEKDVPCLTRVVTYINPASKLVKSVKATEEQMYVKADERSYAILVHVSTPDVPYGNCFQVELLYKIMPGPQSSTNEETTRVVISWNVNFNQSTVMKHVIEGSAKQGLKESFEIFRDLLSQYAMPVDSSELVLDKNQLLAPLEEEHHSDWELGMEYLCNFTVISAISMGLYILTHIVLLWSGKVKGLEFSGLDLPDTFGEMISCGVFVLLGERAFYMISHFVKARLRRVSDHGIKAQGDGWRLTVALIEGSNLSLVSSGFSDPYVMFNCNGQTRTSSVQLETRDPLWNEILEFDAMQEPPSVLEVEVFDFDGPFDESVSLGRAEINFLKYSSTELADLWVPLDTKITHTSDSKLHLRIFLDNTRGSDAIKEYLNKMEKEVGKKLILRSPHRNSTFQKLFSLPEDEFLINDYSCYLRRKLPIQGRLYLSARIVGFHANLFGHKTIFFFLWEDIEDIQVASPSFSTVGSPALLFILKSGRGGDAKIGAKSKDKQGRLKFQFQAFVSFSSASRTILGLWRTKCQNFEQNAKLEEDIDQDGSFRRAGDREYIKSSDGIELSKIFSTDLSLSVETLMQIFDGGELEKNVMEEVGCLNYSTTIWEMDEVTHGFRREVRYKFNRQLSIFGGEVTSVQHRTPNLENNGWVIDEVMTIHNVPFGDHFNVNLKYVMKSTTEQEASSINIFLGVKWMKSNKFKKRITRNIRHKLAHRSREIIDLTEKELLSPKALSGSNAADVQKVVAGIKRGNNMI